VRIPDPDRNGSHSVRLSNRRNRHRDFPLLLDIPGRTERRDVDAEAFREVEAEEA